MTLFDYTYNNDSFNLKLVASSRKCRHYSVEFPTAFPTTYPVVGAGQGDYFQPREIKNTPLIILLHGIGDRSIIPCKFLARALANQGIATFILYLPVHTKRMTPDMKRRFPHLTNEEWAEAYRISVVNVRQIIDWAGQQSEIDNRHIGLIGISFGGFISAITMGIDKRISSSALIAMGGNSAKISQLSHLRSTRRRYGLPEEQYRQLQDTYTKYLDAVARQGLDNVTPPVNSFLTDSLTYAGLLRDRPVYMVNALWDEVVPREATIDFWKASGKPDITWLPTEHASIWLWYPLISHRINRFFHRTLVS
jgi:predicted esterase